MLPSLCTDLYQLSMLGAYFAKGMQDQRASFEVSVRRMPPNRRFMVFMGLRRVLEYLATLRFRDDDILYLRTIPQLRPIMTEAFVEYLETFSFKGDVWAMTEGEVFFPGEPILRVDASLGEAQFVETAVLSIINSASAVASKAARLCQAARGKELFEFGTRRTSPEEAIETARAAYIVGFNATSNVEAGKRYGIPVVGTMAHSWVMAHEAERRALLDWAFIFPDPSMIVDTYDTISGVHKAIAAAAHEGRRLHSIRIDSGDLADLSKQAREVLDCNALTSTKIYASGDLDEDEIEQLVHDGAPIDGFGVGTQLARVADAPALGGVYKLVEIEGRPVAKLQKGKETLPGRHQVWRVYDRDRATWMRDMVGMADESFMRNHRPLLVPAVHAGILTTGACQPLESIRDETVKRLATLPNALALSHPTYADYPVTKSVRLEKTIAKLRE